MTAVVLVRCMTVVVPVVGLRSLMMVLMGHIRLLLHHLRRCILLLHLLLLLGPCTG
jgi:hypothetical protein